jgi:hypothetical protein
MRFQLTQRFAAPVADVADAFCDPGFYELLADSPKLGRPEVLDRLVDATGEQVTMQVRYRFTGDLSSAARAVLDPGKLSWVEEAVHDLAAHRVEFVLHPDHYADRFRCSGSYSFTAADDVDATVRHAEGEVKVKAPLVAGAVERAIVSGLREHLDEEVDLLHRFLAGET